LRIGALFGQLSQHRNVFRDQDSDAPDTTSAWRDLCQSSSVSLLVTGNHVELPLQQQSIIASKLA
jgi:hypothetical protein